MIDPWDVLERYAVSLECLGLESKEVLKKLREACQKDTSVNFNGPHWPKLEQTEHYNK